MILRNRTERQGSVPIVFCGIGEREFALELSAVAGVRMSPISLTDSGRGAGTLTEPAANWRVDRGRGSSASALMLSASQRIPSRSVVALADLLGLPAQPHRVVEQIVILRGPRGLWGLRVDRVSRVIQMSPESFSPVPGVVSNAPSCPFKRLILASPGSMPVRQSSQESPVVGRQIDGQSAQPLVPTIGPESFLLLLDPERLWKLARCEPMKSNDALAAERSPVASGATIPSAPEVDRDSPRPATLATPNPIAAVGLATTSRQPARATRSSVLLFAITDFQVKQEFPLMIALSLAQVIAIIDTPPVRKIPNAPSKLLGVLFHRGRAVPLIDLAGCLNLPSPSPGAHHRSVICQSQSGELFAFPSLPGTRTLHAPFPCGAAPEPLGLPADLVLGAFTWEGSLLILPDFQSILS